MLESTTRPLRDLPPDQLAPALQAVLPSLGDPHLPGFLLSMLCTDIPARARTVLDVMTPLFSTRAFTDAGGQGGQLPWLAILANPANFGLTAPVATLLARAWVQHSPCLFGAPPPALTVGKTRMPAGYVFKPAENLWRQTLQAATVGPRLGFSPGKIIQTAISQYKVLASEVASPLLWPLLSNFVNPDPLDPSASPDFSAIGDSSSNSSVLPAPTLLSALAEAGLSPPARFPAWMFGGYSPSLLLGVNIRGNLNGPSALRTLLLTLASPARLAALRQDIAEYPSLIGQWWHPCGAEALLCRAGYQITLPHGGTRSLFSNMLSRASYYHGGLDRVVFPAEIKTEILTHIDQIMTANEEWFVSPSAPPLYFSDGSSATPAQLRAEAFRLPLDQVSSASPTRAPPKPLRL